MSADVEQAAAILRRGGLVAFPTETVYGLGARARDESAVRRVFAAKGRPADHPLIVHLASASELGGWARSNRAAVELAHAFWPGPLTMILSRDPSVSDVVTGGQDTIGVRVPDHPLALALLRALGEGLAAPSANRFGSVSPTTAEHVRAELGTAVDMILDGGPCRVGVESSIVDLSGDAPVLLRPGGVTQAELERVLGRALASASSSSVRAPGTLPSHYAPRAEVRLVAAQDLATAADAARARGENAVLLAAVATSDLPCIVLPDDPEERARRLYAALREVDARGYQVAIVALAGDSGLGQAIDDRLRRAPAPRPDGT